VDRAGVPVETFPKPLRLCDTFVLLLDFEGDPQLLYFFEQEVINHGLNYSPV
jgi:hypothetical protein